MTCVVLVGVNSAIMYTLLSSAMKQNDEIINAAGIPTN